MKGDGKTVVEGLSPRREAPQISSFLTTCHENQGGYRKAVKKKGSFSINFLRKSRAKFTIGGVLRNRLIVFPYTNCGILCML